MTAAVDAWLAQGGARPRADAQRNVERLVVAARAALAEQGVGVTTRDLAQRAGVGLGTLYRRVPALDELLAAILIDTIDEMTRHARQALKAPDPWTAFAEFAEMFVQLRASSCGLQAALSGSVELDLDAHIDRLCRAIGRLVRRAQAAHALREDLSWRDISFVLGSAIPAERTLGLAADPDQWRRSLGIILDGLRARPTQVGDDSAGYRCRP